MGGCLKGPDMKDEQMLNMIDENDDTPQIIIETLSDNELDDNFKQEDNLYTEYRKVSVNVCSKMANHRRPSQAEIENLTHTTRKISKCVHASVDPERLSMLDIADNLVEFARRYTLERPKERHGVYFCNSFNQYLEHRDDLIDPNDPYQVHLEEYNPEWKTGAEEVIKQLKKMDCSKQWVAVEHIGSTAVVDLHAKPILDLMITFKEEEGFHSDLEDFLKQQEISPLPFKIAFKAKTPFSEDDWGFFQIPRNAASGKQMSEVNVHLYVHSTDSARDKIIFRDYLNENKKSRNEYKGVKMDLMKQIKEGQLSVALYAKQKNKIVSTILQRARRRYGSKGSSRTNLLAIPNQCPRGDCIN